jgi:hypothetical protein
MCTARQFESDLIHAVIDDEAIRRARQSSRHFLDDDPRFVLHELRSIVSSNLKATPPADRL